MKMNRTLAMGGLLALATLFPGCRSTGSNAATGALIGGLLGAGGGYAVGHHRGNRTNHALAIGAAGAMAGYIIGDAMDDRDRAQSDLYRAEPVVRDRYYEHDPYCGAQRVIVRERYVGPCESDPYPPGW